MRTVSLLARWDQLASRHLNRSNHHLPGELFAVVSRLGDGWIWFALMGILPFIYGAPGGAVAVAMLVTGAVGTWVYKWLKAVTHRPRPCDRHSGLLLTVAPLDNFSFPSGHTMHAVSFTIIAGWCFPVLLGILAPFTLLVALSRLVLGLHYLSDVIAGAALGGMFASLAVAVLRAAGLEGLA